MKNKTNLIKRIRNIIVGNTLPANEDLWLDTSEGEKKGVLKYKGNPIVGGGGNSGYSSTKQTVTLFNDTIETSQVAEGLYQCVVENIDFDLIVGETYTVVFDGTSYDIEAITSQFGYGGVILGEFNGSQVSFETYPFAIMLYTEEGVKSLDLITNIEGSHTVEIKHEEETVTTTPEFKDAVDSVTGYSIDKSGETLYDGTIETIDDDGYISGIITPTITFVEGDTYRVTFNGDEYICKCLNDGRTLYVGAPYTVEDTYDWSTYPFSVDTYNSGGGQYETALVVNQEGSYTLKIEHLTVSTKTTPEFVSMIQGIAGSANCQIIYPDDIVWGDDIYSIYNKAPEAGNIYFMPLTDDMGRYLHPVHIDALNLTNGTGTATIIGNIIGTFNDTLVQSSFSGVINPSSSSTSGLQIANINSEYRLRYKAGSPVG